MCGGSGSRLGSDVEKPLVAVGGQTMVDSVTEALDGSAAERIYAVTSPNAPGTRAHVDVPRIETAGNGYVEDLQRALGGGTTEKPVLTVAADLPLLDSAVVDDVLGRWNGGSITVAVPVTRKRDLGISIDSAVTRDQRRITASGLNVVGGEPERVLVLDDERLAVNVNHDRDIAVARRLREDDFASE